MLYHVHHILNDVDTVRGSFPQFNTARAVAVGLTDAEGGQAYISRASVIQWDSRGNDDAKIKCIKDRCFSPVACGAFGYCRELNFDLDLRIKIVCPNPAVQVYDALVDGVRIGSWGNSLDAEIGARSYLRAKAE